MKRSFYHIHNDLISKERFYEDWYSVEDFLKICDDADLWIVDKDKVVIDWRYSND